MRARPSLLTIVSAVLGLSSLGAAEVIELKTGQRIEGNLREATAKRVVVEVGGQSITFPAEKVRAIYYDSRPPVAPVSPVTPAANLRTDAIASLRAIRSALNAGANLEVFRKYHVESKVKVDQLPYTAENTVIREISGLYGDALTFGITRMTGVISDSDLSAAKEKYKSQLPSFIDARFTDTLNRLDSAVSPSQNARELNRINAEPLSKVLVLLASKRLDELN